QTEEGRYRYRRRPHRQRRPMLPGHAGAAPARYSLAGAAAGAAFVPEGDLPEDDESDLALSVLLFGPSVLAGSDLAVSPFTASTFAGSAVFAGGESLDSEGVSLRA